MKKKYFNQKLSRRAKNNLKRKGNSRKMFSRRLGGIVGVSLILENRNVNSSQLAKEKKEV